MQLAASRNAVPLAQGDVRPGRTRELRVPPGAIDLSITGPSGEARAPRHLEVGSGSRVVVHLEP